MQNVKIVRGTSNTFSISLTDAAGEPYVLESGDVLRFGVKKLKTDTDRIIEKTLDSSDYSEGAYLLKLDPDDTLECEFGTYFYDIGLQSGGDYFNVVEYSRFEIVPNITERVSST